MVQPNLKLYPLMHVSPALYARALEKQLQELAEQTKTKITFNFEEQYFLIQGRSQQACDNAGKPLIERLFPQMAVDGFDAQCFHGCFESVDSMLATRSAISSASSSRNSSNSNLAQIQGRPFNFNEAERSGTPTIDNMNAVNNTNTDNNTSETPVSSTPTPTSDKVFKYPDDFDSDSSYYDSEDDDEFIETFSFAKNIKEPREVLTGPPGINNKPADYLVEVGNDTGTECSLHDRQIKIVGSSEEAVNEAKLRFLNLQTMFKRRNRGTNIVPCVHYPVDVPEFMLYFCAYERYAYKKFINFTETPQKPLYVLLPVLKDKAGRAQRPKDLLDGPVSFMTSPAAASVAYSPAPPRSPMQTPQQQQRKMMMSPQPRTQQSQPQSQQQQQHSDLSLDERMQLATLEHKHNYGNLNQGMAPDQQPLWGENKSYVVRGSSQPRPAQPVPSNRFGAPPPPQVSSNDEFPTLPTTPRVATINNKPQVRRVLKISKQKASPKAPRPGKSNMEIVKDYNFKNIKEALEDGLTTVRGIGGDVRLSAKLGKILWSNITPEIQKKMWEFTDLKDILMAEKRVQPHFTNMTTASPAIIEQISNILPSPVNKGVHFEIHARARHQNCLPYKPVIMHMRGNVVEISKVVSARETITEIDWCTLDRKFDFQMKLETEQKTRTNVKPYTTFVNKFCMSPEDKQVAFENIPDFLEVDKVLLKQTTRYRLHFPFIVEITRVEEVPLVTQPYNVNGYHKIIGDIGRGNAWFEMDINYSTHDEIFKRNNSLPVGKMANWELEDILGTDNDALVEYIRCLLLVIEKIETTFEQK